MVLGSLAADPGVRVEPGAARESDGPSASQEVNWWTGKGANFDGIVFPHVHILSTYGGSTGEQGELAVSHHDPRGDGWTVQGFELGLSARPTSWLEGFGTFHLSYDPDEEAWEHEFEEWFGRIKDLPLGLELRGGKYLNRFGIQNSLHQHGWDFVDQHLVNGRFLGDHSLTTIGGELSWTVPVSWTSVLSMSVGVAPDGGHHGHERGEEEEEHAFEAEGAVFDDAFAVANWTNNRDYNDFHQFRFGASGAWGDNAWERTTHIYGLHFEYMWRENGYEAGGRYLRWRNEAMVRSFDGMSGHLPGEDEEAQEEHHGEHEKEKGRDGSFDEFGIYSAVAYGLGNGLEFALRGEFVGGVADAGLDERFRVSPAVTYYFNEQRTLFFRTQYNYDHTSDSGDEHSVWAQAGINWGGPEVH